MKNTGMAGVTHITPNERAGINPEVFSGCADYYPFGMQQPGRTVSATDYRFGFQGMEKDNEVKGEGNHYTTKFRQYDPRVGQWMSIDPKRSAGWSPYNSMQGNPIWFSDPMGDSVNLGNLYEKDEDGNYKNPQKIKEFEQFASTKEGKQWIKKRAEKGFELEGAFVEDLSIKAKEEGSLSAKGVDVSFNVMNLDNHPKIKNSDWAVSSTGANGLTEARISKNDRLKLDFHIDNSSSANHSTSSLMKGVETYVHETMFHGDYKEKLYLQNQSLNNKDAYHSRDLLKSSMYYNQGSKIMQRINKRKGNKYEWGHIWNEMMMPSFGY